MTTIKSIYIYFAVLLIGASAIWMVVIQPYMSEITEFSEEYRDKRVQLATVRKQQDNLVSLSLDFKDVQERVGFLYPIIIKTDESLDFVSELERYATETEVNQSLSISPLVSTSEIQEVPLLIQVDGTINNVVRYLQRLEQSKYYITISSIDFAQFSDDRIDASIQAKTFWIE
ncbi:type 4a pilus biogenesis protein PilO [Patescibacteria group bacterium]